MQTGSALMAWGNQVRGSFLRLTQAKEAPNAIVWGEFDRLALVRLPIVATDVGGRALTTPTVEFRLPDGSAMPHLLLAGAALAMLHGRETPDLDDVLARTSSAIAGDDSGNAEPVPLSFGEVARALERHRRMLEKSRTFPAGVLDHTLASLRERYRGGA